MTGPERSESEFRTMHDYDSLVSAFNVYVLKVSVLPILVQSE